MLFPKTLSILATNSTDVCLNHKDPVISFGVLNLPESNPINTLLTQCGRLLLQVLSHSPFKSSPNPKRLLFSTRTNTRKSHTTRIVYRAPKVLCARILYSTSLFTVFPRIERWMTFICCRHVKRVKHNTRVLIKAMPQYRTIYPSL